MRIFIGLVILLFVFPGVTFGQMRVSIVKATGKLIEMQSGGTTETHLNTLTQNAINAGYKAEDIEVKFISDAEWAVIQADLNKPTAEQILAATKEKLIKDKMRKQAIDALIAEGKLTVAGELPVAIK